MNISRQITHPGEIVEEWINGSGLTQGEFSQRLGVSRRTVCELVSGRRNVSPEMALRLSRLLGTTAESWMNMQASFDLQRTKQRLGKHIKQSIKPLPSYMR